MSAKSKNPRTSSISAAQPLPTVWHAFNLREGPFFQETLVGTAQQAYPTELFVGRKRETQRMLRTLTA